jgi:dolichyl-phosphate beta-glucosyltransferase
MLSIVIPAFNEENRLPFCLEKTIEYVSLQPYEAEIIVVCDGCTDNTAEVAASFKKSFNNLKIIEYPKNRGKGYAVKKGVLEASGNMVLFMDADYAVPIEIIESFIQQMERGYDVVIGARGLKETVITRHQMFLRELSGKAFGRLQRLILKIPYNDTQCGFKLFTKKTAHVLFNKIKYECSYFDAELIYIAYISGIKIKEMPVIWTHDGVTRMPIGVNRTFDLLRKLLKLKGLHKHFLQKNNLRKEQAK